LVPTSRRAAMDAPLATRDAIALSGARVLVVDDQADARDLMRVLLESRGAAVTVAGSAGEALHALRERVFDVLLADIGMPEQDGYSLIRAVRGMAGARGALPAIAITAYASTRERDAALEAGYDWHFAKPVEPEELVATVVAPADADHAAAGARRKPPQRNARSVKRRSTASRGSKRAKPR